MRKFLLPAASALVIAACTPTPQAEVTKARPIAAASTDSLAAPAFVDPALQPAPAAVSRHGNADLAAAFMDLSFALESGRQLPVFSRFEGTITVAMTGAVPASASPDLGHLMGRLRHEAGIDIRAARPGEAPSVTIEFSPRKALRRAAPNAACFVVPNVTSLTEYQASRGSAKVDWTVVRERRQVGIFLPADASPQEVRDCLHEELAQAIGPLNDLYRLPDSVFNDDNFHSVLTAFDMKILRAYYAPELASGMSRPEVAARIGGVFAGINPGGGGYGSADASATPQAWTGAITTALSGGKGQAARRQAAERAIAIARAQGWQDSRLAFSHFALARLLIGSDRAAAVNEFATAAAIYRTLPGAAIHVAHIDMQLAAIAVASGQPDKALRFTDRAMPVIEAAQNHALLATTRLIRAEALDMLGRKAEADRLRVDSAALARYGFGSEAQIRARTREIGALGLRGLFRG